MWRIWRWQHFDLSPQQSLMNGETFYKSREATEKKTNEVIFTENLDMRIESQTGLKTGTWSVISMKQTNFRSVKCKVDREYSLIKKQIHR